MTKTGCHRHPVGMPSAESQHHISSISTEDRAQVLAVFAHELREPLGSILLAAHALSEMASDEITHHEMSNLIERQGRYLARLIEDALQDGRRGGGQLSLRKEWFDLTPVVRDAIDAVAPVLRRKEHRIDVSTPPGPLHLIADPLRVQQVLVNLLANAVKYTPPGGSIHLRVEVCGEHVVIEVRDNGIGMVPALLKRIFDLYEQGPAWSPSAEYCGLGVGLALVKSLVELHGGVVRASSDGVGAGSSFVVSLPMISGSRSATERAAASVERSPTSLDHCSADSAMMDA